MSIESNWHWNSSEEVQLLGKPDRLSLSLLVYRVRVCVSDVYVVAYKQTGEHAHPDSDDKYPNLFKQVSIARGIGIGCFLFERFGYFGNSSGHIGFTQKPNVRYTCEGEDRCAQRHENPARDLCVLPRLVGEGQLERNE